MLELGVYIHTHTHTLPAPHPPYRTPSSPAEASLGSCPSAGLLNHHISNPRFPAKLKDFFVRITQPFLLPVV